MNNTTKTVRANVGQYAMVITGEGQKAVGSLYEACRAAINAQALDNETSVIKREGRDEYRHLAFFCRVRQQIVATNNATSMERAQIVADFGEPAAI